MEGWDARFRFPKLPGFKYSKQSADIDYRQRAYSVRGNRNAVIGHGSGPLWGSGLPVDYDVWSSVEYRETIYVSGRPTVIDARGVTAGGRRWRQMGRFGETASYRDVDEKAAQLLDRLLDGVCMR